ncbi:hypothetical protein ACFLT1_00355 [Bacteroidota bacterium]
MKEKISVLILIMAILTSCEFQSYSDYEIKPYDGILTFSEVENKAAWKNRFEHAAVAYNGKIWILGGYNPGEVKNDTYYEDVWSSEDGLTWELVSDNAPWKGRKGHTVNVFDDGSGEAMFLIGGFSVDESTGYRQYTNEVWKSTDGLNWDLIKENSETDLKNPDTFFPRMDHVTVVANHGGQEYLFIIGGRTQLKEFDGRLNQRYFNDVWRSTNGIEWEKLANNDYGIRSNHAATVDPETGIIYIQGGQHGVTFESFDKSHPIEEWNYLWSSPDGITWTAEYDEVITMGNMNRVDHSIVFYENAIWCFPGKANYSLHLIFAGSDQYRLWRVDLGTENTWTIEEGSDMKARYSYATTLFDDKIWILGGFTNDNGQDNDVWTANL